MLSWSATLNTHKTLPSLAVTGDSIFTCHSLVNSFNHPSMDTTTLPLPNQRPLIKWNKSFIMFIVCHYSYIYQNIFHLASLLIHHHQQENIRDNKWTCLIVVFNLQCYYFCLQLKKAMRSRVIRKFRFTGM